MSSHVSVIFTSGRFRCRSFPLCFCKRILISILTESLPREQTDDFFCTSCYFEKIETLGNYIYSTSSKCNEVIKMDSLELIGS